MGRPIGGLFYLHPVAGACSWPSDVYRKYPVRPSKSFVTPPFRDGRSQSLRLRPPKLYAKAGFFFVSTLSVRILPDGRLRRAASAFYILVVMEFPLPSEGYTVYILLCADNTYYVGKTKNLEERLSRHRQGQVSYTAKRLPIKLITFQVFFDEYKAALFEKYLKSHH